MTGGAGAGDLDAKHVVESPAPRDRDRMGLKWADVNKFKGPILRAVSVRPPCFSQPTLDAVVDFYDNRFGIGFTTQEKADLVAFLQAL